MLLRMRRSSVYVVRRPERKKKVSTARLEPSVNCCGKLL